MGYTYAIQRLGKPVITTAQYNTMKGQSWVGCRDEETERWGQGD